MSKYALVPILLAVYGFGLRVGLLAAVSTLLFLLNRALVFSAWPH